MAGVDPFKLIEAGYKIFPLRVENPGTSEKKLRFIAGGSWNEIASSDPARIAAWNSELRDKITDWGIPTGHVNGLVVVDIDTPEADHWWEAKWLPAGLDVQTPRGGRHIIYSIDGLDIDVKSTASQVHPGVDTRGEGGFVVAYADDLTDIPELPESVMELLPEKQVYNTAQPPASVTPDLDEPVLQVNLPGTDKAVHVGESEARSLQGLTSLLDRLPRPWREGAGYHDTQFMVACGLNRIANSPYYRTTREEAEAIFMAHAPLRDNDDIPVRQKRWDDAVKTADGQWFDMPTDVPLRLNGPELVEKFKDSSAVDRLFWGSRTIGDVKDLIRELREAGASAQEAYSISYDCATMKRLREANPQHSGSTWGFTKSIYGLDATTDVPDMLEELDKEESKPVSSGPEDASIEFRLLSPNERDLIRNYPNVIDRYIMAAQEMLPEPNMPLHYVNAWIWLSCTVGDRGDIMLTKGRRPCNLWGMPLAESASGKGDAKDVLLMAVDTCRRGGFGDINAGGNASAEALSDFITERDGKVTFFNRDESGSLLEAMHKEGSYESKMMALALDLYDGNVTKNLRVGNAKEGVGGNVRTTFNMWLQTTWQGAVGAMDEKDIETGFIGRFLVAVGDDAKITAESLRPQFASEYQVQSDGVHPMIKSMSDGMNAVIGRVKNITISADDDVLDRYVKMRQDVLAAIERHPRSRQLSGVLLRVTENMLKGAALLAMSEGRGKIEMPDLLIAIKSGQYWVRDAMRLIEAVSKSEYRRHIDTVIRLCEISPKTRSQILRAFENRSGREVSEFIERAEQEGSIKRDDGGKRWIAVERN